MKLPHVKTNIQIRFTDIDLLGHVSNSVYLQYFDIGRIHFFEDMQKAGERQQTVVASIHMDMIKEIRYKDEVYIETWCSKKGNKSMTIEQKIFSNYILAAKGTTILVGFDLESRQSKKLPEHWKPSV